MFFLLGVTTLSGTIFILVRTTFHPLERLVISCHLFELAVAKKQPKSYPPLKRKLSDAFSHGKL